VQCGWICCPEWRCPPTTPDIEIWALCQANASLL